MKPWLCAAGMNAAEQLRDQIDTWYPDRRTTSDGWIGDARHSASKSDHNPDKRSGFVVRAIDVDSRLDSSEGISIYLADQIRKCAKTDKRISYVIHNGKIASRILNYKWRTYRGFNKHIRHIHISFTKAGDKNGKPFDIPLLGGKI
jgi:hypothetical protein